MLPAIVIPAYSRPIALKRLLNSILHSDIPVGEVKIIISLDGGYLKSVENIAETFITRNPHLPIDLIKREENIGLKNHILWCGDLTEEYGAVIVLEDDLIVSKDFYQYASSALNFYESDDSIAGVSLYSQRFNEYANLPFEPMHNGSDVYLMQIASSWGQAWSRRQWIQFKEWYETFDETLMYSIIDLPKNVVLWPETSWKKFFSAYLVLKNKYFVYPFESKTSNCADDGGQHTLDAINYLQVPITFKYFNKDAYNFINPEDEFIKYDAFMEAVIPSSFSIVGINISSIAIDLYGLKPLELINKYEYVITNKKYNKAISNLPLRYKPIENNILLFDDKTSSGDNNFNYFVLARSSELSSSKNISKYINYFKVVEYFSYFKIRTKRFDFSYLLSRLK